MGEDAAGGHHVPDCPFHRLQLLQEARRQEGGCLQDQAGTVREEEHEDALFYNVLFLPVWFPVKGPRQFHNPRQHPVPLASPNSLRPHLQRRILIKIREGPVPPQIQRLYGQISFQRQKQEDGLDTGGQRFQPQKLIAALSYRLLHLSQEVQSGLCQERARGLQKYG